MFYFYILESESTGRLYIGQTQESEKRLSDHNRGGSPYTKGKGPWRLIYLKEFESRTESLECEKKFKGWKSAVRIKVMILEELNG
jgi:putative endonuclease